MSRRYRHLARVTPVPKLKEGFIGPGHLAAPVIPMHDFAATDPFIALMDDHLDIGERPVGGPHPHAGFETVTLILDGAIRDRDEGGVIEAGEVQWMTAGSGIIHGENVEALGKVRLLQLWLSLPKNHRWTTPRFQDLHHAAIPTLHEGGVKVRLNSGASGSLRARTLNHVPVTLAEITLAPGKSFEQELPASYNGFVFVVSGSVLVGESGDWVATNQVGWLDRPAGGSVGGDADFTVVRLAAGADGARLVLYAGEPTGAAIVSHGPFIGDSHDDIARLYREFRAGGFVRLSTLAKEAQLATAAD